MQAQTTFSGTPDDLEAALIRVVAPLIEQIRELKGQQQPAKLIYTVAEIATLLSYSPQMVRRFICTGKESRKGKTIYLKAKEITKGDYRITSMDLDLFLSHF